MPIIILILSAVGGALWFWVRSNPRDAYFVAKDAATTLKNAPRRLAFRRQSNAHPVEGIDDPRIAVCAIAQAFIELDDLPTQEQRQKLHIALRSQLRCDEAEAEEMQVLGRWLLTQCNGPASAIQRLAKKLRKIDGDNSWDTLRDILMGLVENELSSRQTNAIEDLRIVFRK